MERYSLAQRVLHWVIAVMVLGALTVGWTLGTLGFQSTVETFGQAMTNTLYKYHKTFGILILGLMLIRIVLKLVLPSPAYDPPLSRFDRIASGAVHGVLYVALVGMAVTGWLGTGASGFPVEFFEWELPKVLDKDRAVGTLLIYTVHGVFGYVITLCVFLHIGGALKHWLVNKDGVMGRMSLI
ncbi:MAG: cytochrome b [Pseudomonadota bacterium]